MQDFANAVGNLGCTDEMCSSIAAATQLGSATLSKNPQTVPANGHEMMLKVY